MVQGMFDIGAEKERERMRERARRGDGETGRRGDMTYRAYPWLGESFSR